MKLNGIKQLRRSLAFVFFTLVVVGCASESTKKEEPIKPNIVYILADDLGYGDVSCYGQEKFSTPNIDKLAENGMRFTQHYAGSTVCAPSRSALMTGLHTGHTDIRGNVRHEPEGQIPLNDATITLAERLKEAGYVTGAFGKWGLGYPGSSGDPNQQGFDEFYGYNCQTLGHNYYPYHLWHNQTKVMLEENAGFETGLYAPVKIHEQALQFIEQNKDTTFFLYYPTIIPHAELVAPQAYMEKYTGKFSPETPYIQKDSVRRYKLGGYGSQPEPHAAFVAMVDLLDEQVGEIQAKLEELGIAENTLIVFTSDNGPHQEGGGDPDYFNGNGDLTGYKRDLYEGGIRVPMIAVWPGKVQANSTSAHISAFWDVVPTFCELSGSTVPQAVDGISFLPELLGKEQQKHPYLYWEFHEQGGKQAVRIDNWKAVRLNMAENPDAEIELYDLQNDIAEQNNLAAEYPELVQKMAAIMTREHVKSETFSFPFEN